MPKIALKSKNSFKIPLIRIRRFSQVTLPPSLREKFNLAEGDYLSAQAVEEGILLKPSKVSDKRAAWKDLIKIINKDKSTPLSRKMTEKVAEEEITEAIKDIRKQNAQSRL